jgi:hypothetical protein
MIKVYSCNKDFDIQVVDKALHGKQGISDILFTLYSYGALKNRIIITLVSGILPVVNNIAILSLKIKKLM